MSSVIYTNMASLYAQNSLSGAQSALSTSVQRLSSGLRINSAKDDAAGLGISQNLMAQIGSVNQAINNANDGISMLQTAEGAMSEISNIYQRMSVLSTQAADGSLATTQLSAIGSELSQLSQEVDKIASRTTFNGIQLLTGSAGSAGTTSGSVTVDTSAATTIQNGLTVGTTKQVSISNVSLYGPAKPSTTYSLAENSTAHTLTLTDGSGLSQTLNIGNSGTIAANSSQTFDFSQFGVKFTVNNNALTSTDDSAATNGVASLNGKTLVTSGGLQVDSASPINKGTSFTTTSGTTTATFGTVTLYGSAQTSTSYQISVDSTNNNITLTDGSGKSQSIAMIDTNAQGAANTGATQGTIAATKSETLDFTQFGVKFTLTAGSADLTATDLYNTISGITNSFKNPTAFSIKTASSVTTASGSTSGQGVAFQVGATSSDTLFINAFSDVRMTVDGNTATSSNYGKVFSAIQAFNATGGGTISNAQALGTAVNQAITDISSARSTIGAYQNRLDHTIANLQAQSDNLAQAKSRITDTDYASETAQLTKGQIMQQAATAMLAQANQMPNAILTLLK